MGWEEEKEEGRRRRRRMPVLGADLQLTFRCEGQTTRAVDAVSTVTLPLLCIKSVDAAHSKREGVGQTPMYTVPSAMMREADVR